MKRVIIFIILMALCSCGMPMRRYYIVFNITDIKGNVKQTRFMPIYYIGKIKTYQDILHLNKSLSPNTTGYANVISYEEIKVKKHKEKGIVIYDNN